MVIVVNCRVFCSKLCRILACLKLQLPTPYSLHCTVQAWFDLFLQKLCIELTVNLLFMCPGQFVIYVPWSKVVQYKMNRVVLGTKLSMTHKIWIILNRFTLCMYHCGPSGFISNMTVHRQYFPDQEDEKGAAKALMRLQDTYKLDSESFARGKLPGKEGVLLFSLWLPADTDKITPMLPRKILEASICVITVCELSVSQPGPSRTLRTS